MILYVIIYLIIFCLFYYFFYKSPIDAVITYVDHHDPCWIEEKNKWSENTTVPNNNFRWTNSNELKYCLTCIKKNCNIFRKIFLVVSNESQIPDYLVDFPEVTVVLHKDFFRFPVHLPVFNSMSIESNICFINGLAEHFVYINDDVFINKKIDRSFFIGENGKINVYLEKNFSPKGPVLNNEIGFLCAWKNTNKILDNMFIVQPRYFVQHIPQIQLKSIHFKLWEIFFDKMYNTSYSKFRNENCNLVNAGLAEYTAYYLGKANLINKQVGIQVFINNDKKRNQEIFNHLYDNQYIIINLQNNITSGNTTELIHFMENFFQK
jgi:hypothetical protein